jgi:hypothetical protein
MFSQKVRLPVFQRSFYSAIHVVCQAAQGLCVHPVSDQCRSFKGQKRSDIINPAQKS